MKSILRLPAIKGIIGKWVYYQTLIPFSEVVNRIDNDHPIRENQALDDILQRELSGRSKKIGEYLLRENNRFFNTAIVGLFGDSPKWYTFEYSNPIFAEYKLTDRMAQTIGILELSGDEILFSIDGQHRIEGIKQALKKDAKRFEKDELPIIIVGHEDTIDGKKRTRRLFSEINTKAVRVSGLDDLITNEENPIHINARKLFADFKLFKKEKFILLSHKANIDANAKEFTTILNLKEINKILYEPEYKHLEYRPSDKEIESLYKIAQTFWTNAINNIQVYSDVLISHKKEVKDYRNSEGGSLLFRPVGIKMLAEGYIQCQLQKKSITTFWKKINSNSFDLENKYWSQIIWDSARKNMIPKRESLLKEYFYYLMGLEYEKDYLEVEFNKAFGVSETQKKDRKKLPRAF